MTLTGGAVRTTDSRRPVREAVLTTAGLLWLAAYATTVLRPDLGAGPRGVCEAVGILVWVAFGVDFGWRWFRSGRRRAFIRANQVDLALLVLPALRPLRMLRLLTLLHVLNRSGGSSLRGRVGVYVATATILVGFCAALGVLDAERGAPGALITTFPDACWWVTTTITTVGYGDLYPVTGTGRLVAVALMLAGIALLGTVTASLASWFIERVGAEQEGSAAATRADDAALTREVRELRAELRRREN
ncbi:potassium channel family protein [Kineococcus gynurae]|uniref:Potassium channel family protein n=1 Tax=Kineococcus gynurae TaxID=452979 RepID=A0ABV5LNL6_9ACTN